MQATIKSALAGAVCLAAVATTLLHVKTTAQGTAPGYANFEGSQANPVRLSKDGTRLFAVNTPNGSLSVFDVTTPANPKQIASIPVGVEPVSVNALTNDEAWVVNQGSNSVSVVSVSKGIVVDTINLAAMSTQKTPLAEPIDLVFSGTQAYISVSRTNTILVVDAASHSMVAALPVFGGSPRAMAVSPDGSKVYAAFAISGNGTTIVPGKQAPPQPPPTNPALPPPPQVGLIISASDPAWQSYVKFKMPDNDVVAINTGATPSIAGYYSHVGTINLGLGVNPVTGDLFVANTDALNLIHFETNLLGHYVNNRITRITVADGTVTPFDLNPNIDYSVLPNTAALATSLAQPTNVTFDPSGSFMYVAAFGTDRVAKVDTSGNVLSFVEVAQTSGQGSNVDPANKRGPRGLALNAGASTLYSLNRISNTISVINTASNSVVGEIPVGNDPTPAQVKQGRGFLYDAKLSGNGTGSCASCHVDGDMDHIAWDLGDPAGTMGSTVQNGKLILFHPMKGAMTTQTFHGLANLAPFHWRGDKPEFQAFNGAFPGLMGAPSISNDDMNTYTTFANSIYYLPNPYENLDRTLPKILAGGHPLTGINDFMTLPLTGGTVTCNNCHESNPGPGSNLRIDTKFPQPTKNPQLRNMYQKLLFSRAPGGSTIDGFGLNHDGDADGFATFFMGTTFRQYSQTQKADMAAYEMAYDTGTAPAMGYTRTLTSANVATRKMQYEWTLLQSQATAGNIDLIVRGTLSKQVHGLMYQVAGNNYISDTGALFTQAQLQTLVQNGDTLTIMGVYPGTGSAAAH